MLGPASPSRAITSEPAVDPLHHLARAALVVVVLGVLPFAWDAHAVWQVLGTLVSIAMVARSLQVLWRSGFRNHPRHLVQG